MTRDDDRKRRLEVAEGMARRWESDDDLVVECPLCGVISDSRSRTCPCGWDLSRKDGAAVRRRTRLQRIGGSALLVAVGVGVSVLLFAADRGRVWVHYGAILSGVAGLLGGFWYLFLGPGRTSRRG